MANRISQSFTFALGAGSPKARVTESFTFALAAGTPNVHVSRSRAYALAAGTPNARVVQLGVWIFADTAQPGVAAAPIMEFICP